MWQWDAAHFSAKSWAPAPPRDRVPRLDADMDTDGLRQWFVDRHEPCVLAGWACGGRPFWVSGWGPQPRRGSQPAGCELQGVDYIVEGTQHIAGCSLRLACSWPTIDSSSESSIKELLLLLYSALTRPLDRITDAVHA